MDRRNVLATVAAVAVASTAVGWFAGQQIKSPAEIAADAAPPAPSLITVPVESRVLSSTVIVRGTVTFDEQTQISVAAGSGSSVVTRVPIEAGQELTEGAVIVEVGGRPVIVLAGELPVFRNLTPGLEGPDVQQLEAALVRLGFDTGTVDTIFDAKTEAAVEEFYRGLGYQPDQPSTEELASLDAARDRVRNAQESVRTAQNAVNNSGVSQSARLQADQDVVNAEQSLTLATQKAGVANAEAAAAVATAQAAFNADQTPENRAALDAALAQQTLTATEQNQAVTEATSAVAIAKARRTELLAGADTAGAAKQLTDAQAELTGAQEDLNRIDATIGVSFPASELVFLPTLPRQVQTVNATPGKPIEGSVMTVSGSGTLIESGISANDRSLVSVGTAALIEDDSLGISIGATVSFIADNPGGGQLSADRYAMRLEPNEPLPEEAYGLNLRIEIPIESTGGEVLAVPLAALSAGPDGSARVEVERVTGETELITVTTGLRAGGYVEISPTAGAPLAAGDRVVVGRDLELPGATGEDGESETESDTGSDTESDDATTESTVEAEAEG